MAQSTTVRLADSRDKSRRYATCGLETGHLNGAAIMPLRNLRSGNRAPEWRSHIIAATGANEHSATRTAQ
ncbi:hypothetical protein [Pantoea dispersa]|uniref:hypothetical protein n=1 Tax=Pantoea dispersa TaxID=59814 RepID=UPI0021C7DF15|nr:hypothetical protein [Pantoea dispersa]UXO68642.1 hypothetical protein N7977_00945 [Pantoea dispersa]